MEVPGAEDYALVVETDSLPPKFYDSFIETVSNEGQKSSNLSEVLAKKIFPTGENMLKALHDHGKLTKVHSSRLEMFTVGMNTIKLSEIVNELRKSKGVSNLVESKELVDNSEFPKSKIKPSVMSPEDEAKKLLTQAQLLENANSHALSPEDEAKNLLAQAKLIEDDVKFLRNKAYTLCPDLKPKRGRKKQATKESE